jgi:ribosome-associated protein
VASSIRVNSQIVIPEKELRFSFVRSSGPGGQNVNKVASKAVLRWSIVESPSIPEAVRARFLARWQRRINDRGELVITSQRYREQAKNVADCIQKLRELLLAVATPRVPRKRTRLPKSAEQSRLREKRSIADKKRHRRPPGNDE